MDEVSSTSPTSAAASGGGGMSRAAKKKREKKKKKKQQLKHIDTTGTKKKNRNDDHPRGDIDSTTKEEEDKEKKRSRERSDQEGNGNTTKQKRVAMDGKDASSNKKRKPISDERRPTEKEDVAGSSTAAVDHPPIDIVCDLDAGDDSPDFAVPSSVEGEETTTVTKLSQLIGSSSSSSSAAENSSSSAMMMTCQDRARAALAFLLHPSGVSVEEFYSVYVENQPLCIRALEASTASSSSAERVKAYRRRFEGFLSMESIREMSRDMCYGRDLNVTRYQKDEADGVRRRITLDDLLIQQSNNNNQKKKRSTKNNTTDLVPVDPDVLFDTYFSKKRCTVRLLCPHKHSDAVFGLVSLLEQEFGCMVGCNAYLTPGLASQGFSPHYDDIEAYILQLEGQKRWKVYAPLSKTEVLPRTSSRDYTDADLEDVVPVLDVVLEPGDMLYMPRGWIHQGVTLPRESDGVNEGNNVEHSLHLTLSTMQQWAWVDFMEMLLPEAVQSLAAGESLALRQGLPRNFLQYMGAIYDSGEDTVPDILKNKVADDEDEDPEESLRLANTMRFREEFRAEAKKRITKVAAEAMGMLDAVCDQMGKRFISERVPPALTSEEKAATSQEGSEPLQILPATLCRLARPGIARLALEDGQAVLYHCADNSRVYKEQPLSPMEFEMDDAPAIEQLLTTTEPHWIFVNDLIHDTIEDKVGVARALYDEGILAIRN